MSDTTAYIHIDGIKGEKIHIPVNHITTIMEDRDDENYCYIYLSDGRSHYVRYEAEEVLQLVFNA